MAWTPGHLGRRQPTQSSIKIDGRTPLDLQQTNRVTVRTLTVRILMEREVPETTVSFRTWITFFTLIFINVMSYCDRFVLAVLIPEIEEDFQIEHDLAGLLQSSFYVLFVFFVPLFGYLGDRFNRKYLLVFSVSLWNVCNFSSSFANTYWLFFTMRALFGAGNAGHTTISPIVLGDLFVGSLRTKALAIYYLAIPFGLGLAYILGRQLEVAFGSWRWSLRLTPAMCMLTICLMIIAMKEPVRGEIEGISFSADLLFQDVHYLSKNTSFVLSTIAFICTAFTTQAVGWWVPNMVSLGAVLNNRDIDLGMIISVFGVIAIFTGTVGIIAGYILSVRLKHKCPQIDPVVSGLGLLISIPILIGASLAITVNIPVSFVLFGLGFILANMNWALMTDILLSVVMPNKRGLALGVQLFVGHAFGSLSSPYIVGLLSVHFQKQNLSMDEKWNEFLALQKAVFFMCIAILVGSILLLVCGCFIVDDIKTMRAAQNKHGTSE